MNFTILASLIIVVLGLYFRIIPYEHIQGLWNDEYVGWFISQKPLLQPFIKAMLEQCHLPLYYVFLKIYTSIFGNSDVVLRSSSTIIGLISIVTMFFVGKTKSKTLGFVCAFFTAVSGFLIYYSYEVRPYVLIFLLSALSLLFTLRLFEEINKKNLFWYLFFNILILLTHTLGFIYVLTNLIIVAMFLKENKPKYATNIFLTVGVFFLLITPIIIKIFTTISYSQWWGISSFSKLAFMFTDMFSNYLINLLNAPANLFTAITPDYFVFGIIPTTICVIGLVVSLFAENSNAKKLLIIASVPTIILLLVSFTSKFVFLSKYNIEVYPIFIYLSMLGLSSIKRYKLKASLIVTLFVLNIFVLFTPTFKEHFIKPESNKLVAELLNDAHLKKDDVILFTYYPRERFMKYFDYSQYEIREVHKGNFFYYLTPDTSYQEAVLKGKEIYKPIYTSSNNPHFSSMIENEFYQNLKKGSKIAVIFLNSVSMFSDVQLYTITQNDKYYNSTPQPYMIFSYVKNYLIKKMNEYLKIVKYEQNGNWSMIVFEKK